MTNYEKINSLIDRIENKGYKVNIHDNPFCSASLITEIADSVSFIHDSSYLSSIDIYINQTDSAVITYLAAVLQIIIEKEIEDKRNDSINNYKNPNLLKLLNK